MLTRHLYGTRLSRGSSLTALKSDEVPVGEDPRQIPGSTVCMVSFRVLPASGFRMLPALKGESTLAYAAAHACSLLDATYVEKDIVEALHDAHSALLADAFSSLSAAG